MQEWHIKVDDENSNGDVYDQKFLILELILS